MDEGSSSNNYVVRRSQAKDLLERNRLVEEMVDIHGEIETEIRKADRVHRDAARHYEEISNMKSFTVDSKETEESLKDLFGCNNMNQTFNWNLEPIEVIVHGTTRSKRDKRAARVKKIVEDFYGKKEAGRVKITLADV